MGVLKWLEGKASADIELLVRTVVTVASYAQASSTFDLHNVKCQELGGCCCHLLQCHNGDAFAKPKQDWLLRTITHETVERGTS